MAAETIREFLVTLGFKQDESSLRKFEQGINTATKSVLAMAGAVEGTAILVAAYLQRFATGLEALYFAAVRTSSSAAGLKLLDTAAQGLGASAGEAVASVESFAQKLRENPGNLAMLESLIGGVKRAKDGTVVALDAYVKFVQFLKTNFGKPGQEYLAYQYGSFLGLSPQLVQRFLQGDLTQEMKKFMAAVGSGDWDDATKKAHEFEERIRDLNLQFDGIKNRVAAGLFVALQPQLEQLAKWIEQHPKQISDFVTNTLLVLKGAAIGTANAIIAIGNAYDALLKKATAFGQWVADHAPRHFIDMIGDSINEDLHSLGLISEEDYQRGRKYYDQTYLGKPENNPGNLEFHGQAGAVPAGRGGRFASFAKMQEGVDAMARQLELFAARGNNTIRGIVSTYAPPGENDTPGYIAGVMKALGVGDTSALDLKDPKVLEALMSAMIRQEGHGGEVTPEALHQAAVNATRDFRAGTFGDTAFGQWLTGMANRADVAGGTAVGQPLSVNQQTTIHVYGNDDPHATAAKVTQAQKSTNADLARGVAARVQ